MTNIVVTDWEVTVYGAWTDEDYDNPDGIITHWIIEATEAQAEEIAMAIVHEMGDEVADWAMKEVGRDDRT